MPSLSAMERALCEVAGERAADVIMSEVRPLLLALLTEHRTVAAVFKASVAKARGGSRPWLDLIEANKSADAALQTWIGQLEKRQ